MIIFELFIAALLGAFVGKLLYKVVYFLPIILLETPPKDEEVAWVSRELFRRIFLSPRCLFCQAETSWADYFPIIGYFRSKGECRSCKKKIGKLSIALEIGTALLFVLAAIVAVNPIQLLIIVVVSSLIICCFITDYQFKILPDQLTLTLLWAGLAASATGVWGNPVYSIYGAIAGYGIFWAINELFRYIKHKEGMYPGDFKFNAAIGAVFGVYYLLPILLVSLVLLIVFTAIRFFFKEKSFLLNMMREEIAYGCYVAVVSLLFLFFTLYNII